MFARIVAVLFVILAWDSLLLAQEATEPAKDEGLSEKLQATLWVQTSLEYEVACRQAYRQAEQKLTEAIANPNRSAATEQSANFAALPPAVILDVDETVLDNSPFNARLVKTRGIYTPTAWAKWCNEVNAIAIPGSKEFIQKAKSMGAAVFFVTNRDAALKDVTRQNLVKVLGMDVPSGNLLLKNERQEWTSTKTKRRAHVANTHRIALLVGDDVNDFVSLGKLTPAQRKHFSEHFAASWGHHWILLPNPIYGSWEKSLYEYNFNRTPDAKRELLLNGLRTK